MRGEDEVLCPQISLPIAANSPPTTEDENGREDAGTFTEDEAAMGTLLEESIQLAGE